MMVTGFRVAAIWMISLAVSVSSSKTLAMPSGVKIAWLVVASASVTALMTLNCILTVLDSLNPRLMDQTEDRKFWRGFSGREDGIQFVGVVSLSEARYHGDTYTFEKVKNISFDHL